MAKPVPMPTCPMAETCKGMMERPSSVIALIIPGILLIALGVGIVVEPRIFVWVLAAMFVLLGITMLMMASFIRKMGARFRRMHKQSA